MQNLPNSVKENDAFCQVSPITALICPSNPFPPPKPPKCQRKPAGLHDVKAHSSFSPQIFTDSHRFAHVHPHNLHWTPPPKASAQKKSSAASTAAKNFTQKPTSPTPDSTS